MLPRRASSSTRRTTAAARTSPTRTRPRAASSATRARCRTSPERSFFLVLPSLPTSSISLSLGSCTYLYHLAHSLLSRGLPSLAPATQFLLTHCCTLPSSSAPSEATSCKRPSQESSCRGGHREQGSTRCAVDEVKALALLTFANRVAPFHRESLSITHSQGVSTSLEHVVYVEERARRS